MAWDGVEKRKNNNDLLVEMHNDIKHFVKSMEKAETDLKEHKVDFKEHKNEDTANFKRIDKTLYLATGVVTAVVFIVRVLFK